MHGDDAASVRAALTEHLTRTAGGRWTVEAPSHVVQRRWSVLYFLDGTGAGGAPMRWVVKCPRAPEDEAELPGRDSRSLAARNRAEFSSLRAIEDHFARQDDRSLATIEALAYLPTVEGLLMTHFEGQPLFDRCLRFFDQLRPRRRGLASEGVRRAGVWLRWFHQLPLEVLHDPIERGPEDAAAAIRVEIDALVKGRVAEGTLPVKPLEAVAREGRDPTRVASHADYHLRNVVLLDDGGVLGFDTALNRIDSACRDIGRFLADLRTRRARILAWACLPSERRVRRLERAFMAGYADPRLDRQTLALYEALFTLRKWREDGAAVESAFRRWPPLAAIVRTVVIDPAFRRLMRQWVNRLEQPPEGRSPALEPGDVVLGSSPSPPEATGG